MSNKKSISETYFVTSHLVMPRHANPLGILFGGYMMDWIVEAGTINTMRLSGKSTVIGFIDNLFFINPVSIGDTVFYRTWIGRVRRSSMEVIVEAIVRGRENKYYLASIAKMIYVALGSDNRPVKIDLEIEAREDWEFSIMSQLETWRNRVDELIKSSVSAEKPPYAFSKYSVSSLKRVTFEDAMPANMMYGGSLLRYIDEISSILAFGYSGGVVVTASVDQMIFKKPIFVGDVIKILSMITRTWRSSMEIKTLILREKNGEEEILTECYSTFVKLDEKGKPSELKPYNPTTPEEYEEWTKADERRRIRLELAKKLNEYKNKDLGVIDLSDPKPVIRDIL